MKKYGFLSLILALVLSLTACGGGGGNGGGDTQPVIPAGYTSVEVSTKLSGINTFGTSVEFDPHFFSHNIKKGVVKEEDWQIVVDRVEKMEIDRFRVMLLPSWLEPFNDNDDVNTINWDALTPNSVEMQSLYAVLNLAEDNGIDVNLTLWGAEANIALSDSEVEAQIKSQGGHFLVKDNAKTNWVIGTYYPEEFAENFSMFIQLLMGQKGYTCIKEVTPVNEPNWSYQIDGGVDFNDYKELCLALNERFVKDGIRDDVLFNLSDNTDVGTPWLESTMNELDDITDIYNSHTYIFGYETTNKTIQAWQNENMNIIRMTGKPHVIGEFGSNQTTGSSRQKDIDEYRRGVLIVREMLNFYNVGASGASYWVLFDQYYSYTDPYDSMMQLGLWKCTKSSYWTDTAYYETVKEDYEVRPQYYAFSLMSKHVPKGAEVYAINLNNDFAIGTAFKGADGKWTYVFANGNAEGETLKIALQNGANGGQFDKYVYAEGSLPQGDDLISASGTASFENKVLQVELAPQTVVLYKQR